MTSLDQYQGNLYNLDMSKGSRIRAARKATGQTQIQLARKLKVSTQAISQWENGRTVPEAERFPAIASALRTSVNSLFETATDDQPRARADDIELTPYDFQLLGRACALLMQVWSDEVGAVQVLQALRQVVVQHQGEKELLDDDFLRSKVQDVIGLQRAGLLTLPPRKT